MLPFSYKNLCNFYYISYDSKRDECAVFPAMFSLQTGDWTWLKEFYQRLIDQKWQRKKKSKEHWYQKAILSKFLYYR